MDLQSQVLHGYTAVFLESFQYLDVGLVEFLGHGGRVFFCIQGVFQRPALHNFYKNNKSQENTTIFKCFLVRIFYSI